MATLSWLTLFVLLVVPIGLAILWAGGIPPKDAVTSGWTGSQAKGRSTALVAVSVLALALAVLAAWVGIRVRRERDEVRKLDAERVQDQAALAN